jgi:hypothetical protein
MGAIQDLSVLITQFKQAADAYSQLLSTRPVGDSKNPEPLHYIASCASDPLVQIASELNLSAQVKKAMKVIRNLSAVAFTVRLLVKVSRVRKIDILSTDTLDHFRLTASPSLQRIKHWSTCYLPNRSLGQKKR